MALTRLKIRRDFLYVARGASVAQKGLVVQARSGAGENDACARVGFTASKKVGNAVMRNRCKRRLRAAAQALLPLYGQTGWDYVFVARIHTRSRAWPDLLGDMKQALLAVTQKQGRNAPRNRRHSAGRQAAVKE